MKKNAAQAERLVGVIDALADDNLHSETDFDRAYGDRTWEWYQGLLNNLLGLGLTSPVLDLGCGLGLFVECCHRNGIRCIGLEGSTYAVERALARVPALDIRQHYLSNPLPFPDGAIATVVLFQVIEHLNPSLSAFVLMESRRVLCNGGMLYVASPSAHNRKERSERTHINLYTPTRLGVELREAGFERVIRLDAPRAILGHSALSERVARWIFSLYHPDWLSATANCVAFVGIPAPPEREQ